MSDAIDELIEYFKAREDILDGSNGPQANEEMQMLGHLDRVADRIAALTAEVEALRDLLRDEFNRGHRLDSPWDCAESDCPGFKQPMRKSCGCYQDATKAHIAKVLKEINQS